MFHRNGPTFLELTKQCLSSTERGYDLLASKFDVTPFRTPEFILEKFAESIESQGPYESILDVCCGTGAAMQALQRHCSSRMVGVDFSQGMLDKAKEHLADSTKQIELIREDVLQMSFQEEFDLAICFGAFGHIRPREERVFVTNIAKSLKVGGQFIFVTSEMPSKFSATYWLARSFNAAMHVRNIVIQPRFIMFYLTFLWPNIKPLLESCGFEVNASNLFPQHPKLRLLKRVQATKIES